MNEPALRAAVIASTAFAIGVAPATPPSAATGYTGPGARLACEADVGAGWCRRRGRMAGTRTGRVIVAWTTRAANTSQDVGIGCAEGEAVLVATAPRARHREASVVGIEIAGGTGRLRRVLSWHGALGAAVGGVPPDRDGRAFGPFAALTAHPDAQITVRWPDGRTTRARLALGAQTRRRIAAHTCPPPRANRERR